MPGELHMSPEFGPDRLVVTVKPVTVKQLCGLVLHEPQWRLQSGEQKCFDEAASRILHDFNKALAKFNEGRRVWQHFA